MTMEAFFESKDLTLAKRDITQHEIQALQTEYNLADAHTHQYQSSQQKEIIRRLPEIWYASERNTQKHAEQNFIRAFFKLHSQEAVLERLEDVYLLYSASIAMHITATYLKKNNLRVGLVEPCFDNLHDLMKHMEVPLEPIPEKILAEKSSVYASLEKYAGHLDVVFLVDPNNPTGFSMFHQSTDTFTEIVRFCKDYNKLLIVDFCFAAFLMTSNQPRPDVYKFLESSRVSYIAMEDTGKTWPIQDAKCAMMICSRNINQDIYSIVTSVLLNVSPFVLNLVAEYVNDSIGDGFRSVREVLDINRQEVCRVLEGSVLECQVPLIDTSVAWFRIKNGQMTAQDLQGHLIDNEVYVLPGNYFYWNEPSQGDYYIRVALARDPIEFRNSIRTLREALESYDA